MSLRANVRQPGVLKGLRILVTGPGAGQDAGSQTAVELDGCQPDAIPTAEPLPQRNTYENEERLPDKLRRRGASVVEMPVIAITPPGSWEPLDQALTNLPFYDWLLFASQNAVNSVFDRLKILGKSAEWLRATKIAAIGRVTAAAIEQAGVDPDFIPPEFVQESLVNTFPGYPNLSGLRVLWPRTNIGRTYIVDHFKEAGAQVHVVEAYRTALPADINEISNRLVALLMNHDLDVITLASGQSARNLAFLIRTGLSQIQSSKDRATPALAELISTVTIASIGPETSRQAMQSLGRVDLQAEEFTSDGLVKSLAAHASRIHPGNH